MGSTTQMIGQAVAPTSGEPAPDDAPLAAEIQGPDPLPPALAPDPTRFGDWEKNGRCIDF